MSIGTFFKRKLREKRDNIRQSDYERKNDILYKRHRGEKILFGVMFAIFLIFMISYIFPFIWVLYNSFKTPAEYTHDFISLPSAWTFENYVRAWSYSSSETNYTTIAQMLGMSVLISFTGTLVTVFVSSCAAYVVAKYKFPGRNVIVGVVIFTMIIPIVGSLPSQIQLMDNLGLNDRILGMIFLYSGGFGMNFMLLYSFFKNLSWTYVEAAKIDGASDFRIFFSIILPMAKGPITAISVITLIGLWNDYMTPRIFLPSKPTIAVGLALMKESLSDSYTVLFAAIILTILPIVITFSLFSKVIMENTSVGGLKG